MSTTKTLTAAPGFNLELELHNFFTLSPDLLCIADGRGYFRKVNPGFSTVLGWNEEELLAHPFLHFVHPDDREASVQKLEEQKQGHDVFQFRNRFCTRQGSYVWLSWTSTQSGETGLFYAVAKDITREKEQEEQLLLQQTRIRRANYLARLGGWEQDLVTGQRWASDELYDLLGISRQHYPTITTEQFLQWVHPDDRAYVESQAQKVLLLDHQFYEHRMLAADGQVIYVQSFVEVVREGGVPVRMNGIIQDISRRKEPEIRLQLSEQRFRSLVQHSYDIICILDLQGHYQYVSDSIERNLGYRADELTGTHVLALIHPNDQPLVQQALDRLHTEEFLDDLKPFRFKGKDGRWHWIEGVGKNMIGDPAVGGIVVNTRDVTDKKKLQDKLAHELEERRATINKAAIRAQEREREQLGRELHDNVNQVLTTIKLYTELALDSGVEGKELMQRSVGYLTDCINEIRNISRRLSTPTLGKISLKESIEELVNSLSLAGHLAIDLHIGRLDKKKLNQDVHLGIYRIIQEHLTNVVRHARATRVVIAVENKKDGLEVLITDDGQGFDPSAQRRGIGIANMYGRSENINGRLELLSAPGQGCTLRLRVPL